MDRQTKKDEGVHPATNQTQNVAVVHTTLLIDGTYVRTCIEEMVDNYTVYETTKAGA